MKCIGPVNALGQHVAPFAGSASPRSLVRVLHPGGVGADDHPFVSALHENIHKAPVAAGVLPSVGSLFGESGLDHGNIVQHLHVHRSNLKRLELMVRSLVPSYHLGA
jgi:hypothetical protein